MDPNELIDAQFEKAVSIVQSLPKTGPIQTGYEDKLAMYSLYKQATVGNVKSPRPGLWDMLGRAKWDAWAKHKDVQSHEAKWLYVETLLKVLRKYSDKTIARELVHELEAYGNLGESYAHLSLQNGRSSPAGSSGSESAAAANRTARRNPKAVADYNTTSEEDVTDDDAAGEEASEDGHDEPRPLPSQADPSFRSPSSLSSHMRYRTPMAGSTFSPPPMVPVTQPLPGFTTPSAFGGSASPPTGPSSTSVSTYIPVESYSQKLPYPAHLAHSSAGPSPLPQSRPLHLSQRNNMHPNTQVDPRPPVERALENVQAHIAALTERVEMLESVSGRGRDPTLSHSSLLPNNISNSFLGAGRAWDPTQMGLWSLVTGPMTRIVESLRELTLFLAYVPIEEQNPHPHPRDPRHRLYARARGYKISSPVLLIVRRLLLDASFILAVLGITGWIWRKTGLRRREVYVALGVLWRALTGSEAGSRPGRQMVDRGV
ncbi:ACBP-domain-containing protein [Hysterangium stoloniferum]|nr:ACBP-domain-containing protein [Hysterangium stoloniferum]